MEKNICFSLKNQIEKPREYWVDIARGIGIILVMFAHSPIARNFALYTYVFNMPMFFFLSGYFVNILKYKNYFGYLKNLAKKIMVPYF